MIVCSRCGKPLRIDGWGRWVEVTGEWRTCDGDRPHAPVSREVGRA